jgi:shikimate kinase
VIDQMTGIEDIVLATGGGAVPRSPQPRTSKTRGFVIFACPTRGGQRTRSDKARPLLQCGDPLDRIEKLYAERDPLYREVADLVIDTGRQSVSSLVALVLAKFDEACRLSA